MSNGNSLPNGSNVTFWHALSWGFLRGWSWRALGALSDDPQIGPLTNIGLATALFVAEVVMFVTRERR